MSSTRTAPRSTINRSSSSTLNSHHTNGSTNSIDTNDSSNTSEFDSNLQRSVLMKNLPHSDGIYKNRRFIHQLSVGLLGLPIVVQTNEQERFHGILETIAPNGDILLTSSHRIENNTNDITTLSTALIDLVDTVDSSVQSFDLQKRTIAGANIVEMIAIDFDLTGSGKCMLDETPKVTPLEDDRFNRMENFYGSDDIDPETFEELDRGDDGKAGYDPEDMFVTNKEKFNTKTDFDEGKYTNVPLRELTADEQAEIDRKVYEIEKGIKNEDIDEDDAGVKRPSEFNQTHNIDDGNSNPKHNQSSRMHSNNDRRTDFRTDGDYNPQKRGGGGGGNWRDQRSTGNTNRRGGQNNYSINTNNKPNQRSDQPQYTSSRSSEQTTNNRSQQYNKPRNNNNRYPENLSPHEGRDSPLQMANDDTSRTQRMNSGNISQGQNSGPTSPSTNAPARNMYARNSGQPIGRNSPASYTGSSSSRNNSTNATSPPPASAGNYSQQSNNKMNNKKQSRNDQQQINEDNEQPKQQRNHQQQQQQNSSNNQSNTGPPTRPSQLHTQQVKQQQQQHPQQSQASSANNNNNTIPPPLALPNQDDHPSSHEPINSNQSDSNTHTHLTNAPLYSQHAAGATTPGNAKGNSGLNPEADEFVPVFTRESNSRPESRGASTNSMPVNSYLSHPHPQTLHLLQQQVQQTQVQPQSMIPPPHPQSTAMYPPFYQTQFTGMQPFVNATPQPMNVGMMGATMMPPQTQQSLQGNGPNVANQNATGMTTPNGATGPGYKPNTNAAHSAETGNTNVNNTAPKKAVVSVQQGEQSNIPQQQQQQQQQIAGGQPMLYPAAPTRCCPQDYIQQPMTPQSMQLPQMPFFYSINPLNIPAASGVGPPQNIMISSAGTSGGQAGQVPPSLYYAGGVYTDPRYAVYSSAASVNPNSVGSSWQMARSPPHQQQPADQQRGYGGGQNVVPQALPPSGVPNSNNGGGGGGGAGRSTSTSGPSGQSSAGGQLITPQYTLNGSVPAAYAYAPQPAWYSAQSQVSSPQTNMPPQVTPYGMMYDPSRQAQQQQPPPTYVHQNPYEAAAYFQQAQQQQQQQPLSQQGLDTVPTGNYNR